MKQKQGQRQLYEECIVRTVVYQNAPLRLNWYQTAKKPLDIVELHFSEETSQSITHSVSQQRIQFNN